MSKYDAVIAGYLCVDMIPQFKPGEGFGNIAEVLKPGRLIEVDGMDVTLGGVVGNTGLAMSRFAKKVYLTGLIGDDFIGRIVQDRLSSYGLLTGIETTQQGGTAFGLVVAPPGIDRIFLESPGCNTVFGNDHIDYDVVAQSRLFHFGYPPLLKQFYKEDGDQLYDMFVRIHQMGVLTSLDFSLPDTESESGRIDWNRILQKTLPFVDIFVPSLEEAMQVMMPEEYVEILASADGRDVIDCIPLAMIREVGARIMKAGTKILLIKAGHRGIYLWTGDVSSLNEKAVLKLDTDDWNNRQLWCDIYPVDDTRMKNASGAGDTASAAFLAAILEGETIARSLKYAALAGRNNLYCNDLYSELSDWEEMKNEIGADALHTINDLALSEETNTSGVEKTIYRK